jgi:hypothetical protein
VDEKNPNARSCDAVTPYAFLVNQEAISEKKGSDDESAREMTRKRVVALLNGVTNPPDMFRRPNFLLKKNLALYIVADSLKGAGWKLALYELARKYQGSPRLLETALKLPDGYKVVAAQDASENESFWAIAVNEVQFQLPSGQELIDGIFSTSPSQLRLAATRELVDKMRTEYIYIPQVMTDGDRVALAKVFGATSKERPSLEPHRPPPPKPGKTSGRRGSLR